MSRYNYTIFIFAIAMQTEAGCRGANAVMQQRLLKERIDGVDPQFGGGGITSAVAPVVAADAVCAVVILVAVRQQSRVWGYSSFLLRRFALAKAPGMRFFKMLGSGYEGGFGLKPSASRQAMFCVFDSAAEADTFVASHRVVAAYRERAAEFFSVRLSVLSSRGSWSGRQPLAVGVGTAASPAVAGPVAALTRASIRPLAAVAFWRHAPAAERALGQAPGCLLAVGLGEAPWLRQATFSIWESAAAMDAYARRGAHGQAIQAAAGGRYFSESMFTRFTPSAAEGNWCGREIVLPSAAPACAGQG